MSEFHYYYVVFIYITIAFRSSHRGLGSHCTRCCTNTAQKLSAPKAYIQSIRQDSTDGCRQMGEYNKIMRQ